MKRKYFLVGYTVCIVLFYSVMYLVIQFASKENNTVIRDTLPASITTPLLSGTEPSFPENSALSAVVLDAQSGAVLYSKNSDSRLPMASTTKIMTAKVILDMLNTDTIVTVSKEAATMEGSSIYLSENEKITVETLLYGLLLESGNDAATALATACSGSAEDFAVLMNKIGKEMGLKDTNFANPHGLTAENHFTTAYELAFITSTALKNPKFREIVSTRKYCAPSLDGKFTRYFFNHNKLLSTYHGAIGVKTGYTEAAGRCLVSAASRDNETYICVTLNDRNDWADHTSLLDTAFDSYDCIEIAPKKGFAVNIDGNRYINPEPVYLTVPSGISPVLSYKIEKNDDSCITECYHEGAKLSTFYLVKE